jgi:heme exporter protein B
MSQPGPVQVMVEIIRRDLVIVFRRRADAMTTVFFFVIVTSLFPLGIGPEPAVLRLIGPGVLWVAALLSCLLSLNRLFTADYQDGVLEQLVLIPQPLSVIVMAKVASHWLIAGLPLVVLSPLLGVQYGLSGEALLILMLSLLVGTPTLSLIGSIGAALTLGVRGSSVLVALLVLPLFIPVLIFGAGAVSNHLSGIGAGANLSLLGAAFLLALVLAPWATSAALRLAVE